MYSSWGKKLVSGILTENMDKCNEIVISPLQAEFNRTDAICIER
jgi:hypothetical protein